MSCFPRWEHPESKRAARMRNGVWIMIISMNLPEQPDETECGSWFWYRHWGICKKQLLLYVYERETGEGYAAAGISFFGHYAATGSYKKKDKENNGTATCGIASAVQLVWGFRNWNPMKTEVVAAAMECAGEEQPEGIHIIRGQDIRTYGK